VTEVRKMDYAQPTLLLTYWSIVTRKWTY